MMTVR